MNFILEILRKMELSNKEKRIFPYSVLYKDLIRECRKQGYGLEKVRNELNSLAVNKKIEVNKTINDKSIRLIIWDQ